MALIDLIEQDSRLRRVRKKLDQSVSSVNCKNLVGEIMRIQANRASRKLKRTDVLRSFQNKFLQAQLQNQADRSRITEIKMMCFVEHGEVDIMLQKIRKYVTSNYSAQLQRVASTKAERDQIIDNMFSKTIAQQTKIQNVMKLCDTLIADLDATGWSLTHTLEVVKLVQPKTKEI